MNVYHLSEVQLATRWSISERTLQRWRWKKKGPPYLKIGGRVAYRLADIEAWEDANLQKPDEPERVS